MTDFYKDMYGSNEDEGVKPVAKKETEASLEIKNKSTVIKVDGKMIEIPNLSYVTELEKLVEKQAKAIRKLEHSLSQMRNFVNKQQSTMNELKRTVENKPKFGN